MEAGSEEGGERLILPRAPRRVARFLLAAVAASLAALLCAPADSLAAPSVRIENALSGGTYSGWIDGDVQPGGETTTFELVYDVAGSPWCQSHGPTGSPGESTPASTLGTSGESEVRVEFDLRELLPETGYCVELRATNGSGGTSSEQESFTTARRYAVSADTEAMFQRVNALRAQAGLAPIAADPAISQAAANHSTYWMLNSPPTELLGYHQETPDTPGFTGASPWERCAATGSYCTSEIMAPGADAEEAVNDWVATVYHSLPLADPEEALAGGAQAAGGPAVMDFGWVREFPEGWPPRAALTRYGYPNGVYDGDRGFWGEAPNPLEACAELGLDYTYPVGTALTAWLPASATAHFPVVDGMQLLRLPSRESEPLCPLWQQGNTGYETFAGPGAPRAEQALPETPLEREAEYEVVVDYHYTNPEGPPESYAWRFTTTGRDVTCYAPTEGCSPGEAGSVVSQRVGDDQAPPPTLVVSDLRETRARWRIGQTMARASARAAKKRPPVGTTFSFDLSMAARVSLAFERLAPGWEVRGRCTAPSHGDHRERACTRSVGSGSLTFAGRAGADKVAFDGRLARGNLQAGRYTVRVGAVDAAGQRSNKESLGFTIVG